MQILDLFRPLVIFWGRKRIRVRDAHDGFPLSNANEVREIYDCYLGFCRRYLRRR